MLAAEKKEALELVETIHAKRAPALKKKIPHILLGYQSRWHADKSSVRLARKSRRIGYSWGALAAEAVVEAAKSRGMDQFYTGYNLRMAAEFIGDCAFWARAYGMVMSAIDVSKETVLIDDEKRDIVTYKIVFASGFKIEALSSNPHNWRGRQGHAIIDEAAFHPDLPELIKGALAFLMWGGRVSIVSTDNGEDNYFNELVKEIKEGKNDWSLHCVTFDDALAEGFYKRVCLVLGKEWSKEAEAEYRAAIFASYPSLEDANEELLCIPKRGAGAYFSRMMIENCQIPDVPIIRYTKPADFFMDADREEVTRAWINDNVKPIVDNLEGLRTVFGQDFGRDNDLSVIWVLQKESAETWRTAFILELRRIPFDMQWLIVEYLLDELPLLSHAKFDARGNGQSHAERAIQKAGAHKVEGVMASTKWYAEWWPKYRQCIEDRSFLMPESEDVIADHRCVVNTKTGPTMSEQRVKGSDGEPRHGDSAIAGLLAYVATKEKGEPPAGSTVEADRSVYDARERFKERSRNFGLAAVGRFNQHGRSLGVAA